MNDKKKNSFAVGGLLLGFVSIFIPFFGVLAIVFSSIGLIKLKELGGEGKYHALLGLLIGIFTTIIVFTHLIAMIIR